MTDPALINGHISDAVTQPNVKVRGGAPDLAFGMLETTVSESVNLSIKNALQNPQLQDETG